MDKLKQLYNYLRHRLHVWRNQHKEQTVENNNTPVLYTEEQLMARLKFFVGICLSLTLFGIVFVVLYSLIFVTQPLNAISPIDQKFFELIIPIATFLTGTLSGIMLAGGDKDAQKAALDAANKGWDKPPTPTPAATRVTPNVNSFNAAGGFGASTGSFGSPMSQGFDNFSSPMTSAFDNVGSARPGWDIAQPVATTAGGKAIVPEFPQPLL
jgi:hypothetical protein